MASPLDQFKIDTIIPLNVAGVDASFTNSSAWMTFVVVAASLFLIGGMRKQAIVPGRWQSMVELTYEFIAGMVRDNVGTAGREFFPFIFTLFIFILFANMAGMLPYAFTVTSHIIVTFALAIFIFLGVTIIGVVRNGTKFLSLFLPAGVPIPLIPLLLPIEIISYFIRPITLSVRLCANMMAGHTMLKVVAGFVATLGVFGIAPLAFIVALTGLEFMIAFLQAYVFTILTCIYLNDALHPAH